MSRLIEIAQDLGGLYGERTGLSIHKKHIELDLAARVVYITPVEGWPGKNAEQREVEAQRAFAADDAIVTMRDTLRIIDVDLADIEADIESLEAERRALEWEIRGTLADALSGRQNGHGDVTETAFDDASQLAIDERTVERATRLSEQGWKNHAQAEYNRYRQGQPEHIGPEDVIGGTVIYQSRPEIIEEELPF